ncbi:putative integral membrane protein [Leishmania donovani]|uniref:Putative integral membrane protein n=1 Tax=Leishmania donovani TaxID=5661 RepID=A0A504XX66_LEIDO|nr:putative integral membrane protein [Leishmania donovani]
MLKRSRYLGYFRIVTEPDRDVNISSGLMVASGAVALVQPLLFFGIHVAYPLVRQRQWAVQYDRMLRSAGAGQQEQQAQQRTYALHAESPGHQRLGPPQPGYPLPLEASSGPPLPQGARFFYTPPQNARVAPRDSCVTVAHRATSRLFSFQSISETEADANNAMTSLSLSPSVKKEAQELGSKTPAAAAVPSARRLTSGHPPFYVCTTPSSVKAGEAVASRDRYDDATAVVATAASNTGDAGVGEAIPAVSNSTPPPHSYVTRAMVRSPGSIAIYGSDGTASRRPRRRSPDTEAQRTLDAIDDVDSSTLAAVTEAAQNDAAFRPNASQAQSATNPFNALSTAFASSSVPSLTPPLLLMRPSVARDTTSTQQACTDASSVASSRRSAVAAPTLTSTAAVPRAASAREREVGVLSSEEVQPPKASSKEASQHGQRHLSCSGDFSQRSAASAFLRSLAWLIPTRFTAEASPSQSHPARRPSTSLLSASVRPLPPALLHMYFKSETMFRSLLSAYYIFAGAGILFMYFFGMLWLVRRELQGLDSLVSMAEGWSNVFIYQNVTSAVDAALCSVELDRRCSGGMSLCNATAYASAEAAHNLSCPFCEASQQRLISTFTQLCSIAYDPSVRFTRAFLILLTLSVIASLVSLCVAVFSCGTGVLASVGYASLSKREEAQAMLETGGFFSTENAQGVHASYPPTRASSPLFHAAAADEISSPTTPMAVAPSRERLMHTFEGLHAPSAALLPPSSVVMAEMSSSGAIPLNVKQCDWGRLCGEDEWGEPRHRKAGAAATDSLSLLKALSTGPAIVEDGMLRCIWAHVLALPACRVRLSFRSVCGDCDLVHYGEVVKTAKSAVPEAPTTAARIADLAIGLRRQADIPCNRAT